MGLNKLKIRDLTLDDHKVFASAGPDGMSSKTSFQTMSRFSSGFVGCLTFLTGQKGKEFLYGSFLKATSIRILKIIAPDYVKGQKLIRVLPSGEKVYSKIFNKSFSDQHIRKLAVVEDPELKARVVAIFDHYSQVILETLSKQVFNILKVIPSDRTFTQSPWFDHKGYEKSDSKFYSLDLSSATDRFPLDLQIQVLRLMGLDIYQAMAWKHVMVGLPFTVNPDWGWDSETVRYMVGQPMGARSS